MAVRKLDWMRETERTVAGVYQIIHLEDANVMDKAFTPSSYFTATKQ